jgi:2-haloacid dehalogenase
MRLSDFKALTFDCYGTLIDWETGMIAALKPLTDRVTASLDRDIILEAHARQESRQQRYTPSMRYSDLLSVVYKRLAEEWGVSVDVAECAAYGRSIRDWPAFPDSARRSRISNSTTGSSSSRTSTTSPLRSAMDDLA